MFIGSTFARVGGKSMPVWWRRGRVQVGNGGKIVIKDYMELGAAVTCFEVKDERHITCMIGRLVKIDTHTGVGFPFGGTKAGVINIL